MTGPRPCQDAVQRTSADTNALSPLCSGGSGGGNCAREGKGGTGERAALQGIGRGRHQPLWPGVRAAPPSGGSMHAAPHHLPPPPNCLRAVQGWVWPGGRQMPRVRHVLLRKVSGRWAHCCRGSCLRSLIEQRAHSAPCSLHPVMSPLNSHIPHMPCSCDKNVKACKKCFAGYSLLACAGADKCCRCTAILGCGSCSEEVRRGLGAAVHALCWVSVRPARSCARRRRLLRRALPLRNAPPCLRRKHALRAGSSVWCLQARRRSHSLLAPTRLRTRQGTNVGDDWGVKPPTKCLRCEWPFVRAPHPKTGKCR